MNRHIAKAYGNFAVANLYLLMLSFAFNVFAGWSMSMGAVYLLQIVDAALDNRNLTALRLIFISVGLYTLGFMVRWIGSVIPAYLAAKFSREKKLDIITHLQDISYIDFEKRTIGELYSIIRNDCTLAGDVFYTIFSRIMINVFLFVFAIWAMWGINSPATIVVVGITIVATVVNRYLLVNLKNHFERSREALGKMVSALELCYKGLDTVKTYGAKEYALASIAKYNRLFCENKSKVINVDSIRIGWSGFTEKITFYGILLYLGYLGISGYLSLGGVIAFIALARQASGPVENIFRWFPRLAEQLSGCKRVYDLINIPAKDRSEALSSQLSNIKIRGLTFAYSNGKNVFEGLDFDLSKGNIVELDGASGSGKTTLFKVLMGLYSPSSGSFTVDNKAVNDLSAYSAYTSLENSLFPLSIYQNLSLGEPYITREKCIKLLTGLGQGEWISSLPHGIDTVLDGDISGGQKQALSIARALLSNKPVLLLDEPFSASDSKKTSLILDEIERNKQEKIIFIASHKKF